FAIALDRETGTLWIAADCPSGVSAIRPCARGALIGLDSGGRIRMRLAPSAASFHPGDVSVSPEGIFVSDGQNGAVYIFSRNAKALRPVVKTGIGRSGQG